MFSMRSFDTVPDTWYEAAWANHLKLLWWYTYPSIALSLIGAFSVFTTGYWWIIFFGGLLILFIGTCANPPPNCPTCHESPWELVTRCCPECGKELAERGKAPCPHCESRLERYSSPNSFKSDPLYSVRYCTHCATRLSTNGLRYRTGY